LRWRRHAARLLVPRFDCCPGEFIVKRTLLSCLALGLLAVAPMVAMAQKTAQKPAAQKPAAQKPAAQKPAGQKPALQKSVGQKPTATKTTAPKATAPKPAEDVKPIVVAAFAGYAELKRDLTYLGTVSGNPEIGNQLEAMLNMLTQGQGLNGLDKDRPWGASVSISSDQTKYPILAFLPVEDLDSLLMSLGSLGVAPGEPTDGVYEIKKNNTSTFVKQQAKWAYLAQDAASLETLPADPLKILRGLEKQYDLAVSVNVSNIPQGLRDMGVFLLRSAYEQAIQQGAGADSEQDQLQQQFQRMQLEELVKAINELDQLTLGFSIDAEVNHTVLDLAMTALPDSELAKELAASAKTDAVSQFGGFRLPEAILSLHLNSTASETDIEKTEGMLAGVRAKIAEQIDQDENLNDPRVKAKVKQLIGKLTDVLAETLKQGHINGGLAVVGELPVTIVAGGLVADGAKLEQVAKSFFELTEDEPGQPKPKLDIDKHQGIKFHSLSFPVDDASDNAEQIKEALGETIDVVLGFGKDRFFVGVGQEALPTIKKVIDASMTPSTEKLSPVTLSVALAPLMKIIGAKGNPQALMLVDQLQGGKDHVNLTLEPVDNGVRYRIEAEEGVNKLIGSGLGAGVQGGANAFNQ
jgi:hypothetical protein